MTTFVPALLEWYEKYSRKLPWRGSEDPYAILVSEIMLQQTRVETVIPYYQRWMERFPNIHVLAAASLQDVMSLWEGLGYYSRARNLHLTAQRIIKEFDGRIPSNIGFLRNLPGVGEYTSAAIASIAFGIDAAGVDGNIRRVFSRLLNVTELVNTPAGKRRIQSLAGKYLPPGQAGLYNQALMDLGATVCTSKNPDCLICPLQKYCESYAIGIQDERPLMKKRSPIPEMIVTAAIIHRGDAVLIAQRPLKGLLGGLWEFPGGKKKPGESLQDCLKREIMEELGVSITVGNEMGVYRHAYTHFRVVLHAFFCSLDGGEPSAVEAMDIRWLKYDELREFPMGKIDRLIAMRLLE